MSSPDRPARVLAAPALAETLGEPVPHQVWYREVAVVRHLAHTIIPIEDYRSSLPSYERVVTA